MSKSVYLSTIACGAYHLSKCSNISYTSMNVVSCEPLVVSSHNLYKTNLVYQDFSRRVEIFFTLGHVLLLVTESRDFRDTSLVLSLRVGFARAIL